MPDTLETEVTLALTLTVNVEYEVHGPTRGMRELPGIPLEPDEPAGAEILSVTDAATGQTIALDCIDEDSMATLEERAMEQSACYA